MSLQCACLDGNNVPYILNNFIQTFLVSTLSTIYFLYFLLFAFFLLNNRYSQGQINLFEWSTRTLLIPNEYVKVSGTPLREFTD